MDDVDDRTIRDFLTPEQYQRGLDAIASESDLVLDRDDPGDYAMILNLGRFATAVLHAGCEEAGECIRGSVGNDG